MDQLYATFYPKTRKADAMVPRSKQLLECVSQLPPGQIGWNLPRTKPMTPQSASSSRAQATISGPSQSSSSSTSSRRLIPFDEAMVEKYENILIQNRKENIQILAHNAFALEKVRKKREGSKEIRKFRRFIDQTTQIQSQRQAQLRDIRSTTANPTAGNPLNIEQQHSNPHLDNEHQQQQQPETYNQEEDDRSNQEGSYHEPSSHSSQREGIATPASTNLIQTFQNKDKHGNHTHSSPESKYAEFYVILDKQGNFLTKSDPKRSFYKHAQQHNQQQQNNQRQAEEEHDQQEIPLSSIQHQMTYKSPNFVTKINLSDTSNVSDFLNAAARPPNYLTDEFAWDGVPSSDGTTLNRGFIKRDIQYIQNKQVNRARARATTFSQQTARTPSMNNSVNIHNQLQFQQQIQSQNFQQYSLFQQQQQQQQQQQLLQIEAKKLFQLTESRRPSQNLVIDTSYANSSNTSEGMNLLERLNNYSMTKYKPLLSKSHVQQQQLLEEGNDEQTQKNHQQYPKQNHPHSSNQILKPLTRPSVSASSSRHRPQQSSLQQLNFQNSLPSQRTKQINASGNQQASSLAPYNPAQTLNQYLQRIKTPQDERM